MMKLSFSPLSAAVMPEFMMEVTDENEDNDKSPLELLEETGYESVTEGECLPHHDEHHDEDASSEYDLDGLELGKTYHEIEIDVEDGLRG